MREEVTQVVLSVLGPLESFKEGHQQSEATQVGQKQEN